MSHFMPQPRDPSQIVLVPVSLDSAIPADCDVRMVAEAMEALDWREFEASYAENGRPAYPPQVMCKLLVYGYLKGVRSSRQLEEHSKYDQRFIWLAGGLRPDHTTFARFRREHERELKKMFQGTVRLCTEAGLVLLAVTATDGSKIPARASRRSLYDAKRIARERAAIAQMLAEAEAADRAEEAQAGGGRRGKLPEQLAEAQRRREKLAQLAARLQESGRQKVAGGEADCRVMNTTQGLRPSYNAQLTVDGAQGVIVAAEVTTAETDHDQLLPQLALVVENVGCRPDVMLADTGYSSEGTFAALRERGQGALMPPQGARGERERQDLFASRCFLPEGREGKDEGVLICPAGRELTFRRLAKRRSGQYRIYTAQGKDCRACSFYGECVKAKGKRGRSVEVSVVAAVREAMRQRLQTPEGKALYKLRQQLVERVLAQLKSNHGLNRFLLPDLAGARAEFWLACIAHNGLVYARQVLRAANSAAGGLLAGFIAVVGRLSGRFLALVAIYRPVLCPDG